MIIPKTKTELRQQEEAKLRGQFIAYSKSKESRSSFCERLRMSKDKYYYWRRKFKINIKKRKEKRELNGFIPVEINKNILQQHTLSYMHYELSLKDSAMLRIPADFKAETLKTLLTSLQEVL